MGCSDDLLHCCTRSNVFERILHRRREMGRCSVFHIVNILASCHCGILGSTHETRDYRRKAGRRRGSLLARLVVRWSSDNHESIEEYRRCTCPEWFELCV